jgi:hypothetical protein
MEKIKSIITFAIDQCFINDLEVIQNGMEWAISHRLAVYIESHFTGWNIDCEYIKMGPEYKTKHGSDGKYKRPDIIIHKRGRIDTDSNLLVIEIKMVDGQDDDEQKLLDFTSAPNDERPFQYQFGLKISFLPKPKQRWFVNGEMIEEI